MEVDSALIMEVEGMNAGLIFIALVIIIANFIVSFLFRWVHKNKYEVNDYVYIKTMTQLLIGRSQIS